MSEWVRFAKAPQVPMEGREMQTDVDPEIDPLEEAYSRPCEPHRYVLYQFCDAAPAF